MEPSGVSRKLALMPAGHTNGGVEATCQIKAIDKLKNIPVIAVTAHAMQGDEESDAIEKDADIRCVRRLQPVGGLGDKIFLPTHLGERHNDPAWQ